MSEPVLAKAGRHAFSWRRLCELRRQQLEAWAKTEAPQPALFELRTDCRPRAERTAADRYRHPADMAVMILENMASASAERSNDEAEAQRVRS